MIYTYIPSEEVREAVTEIMAEKGRRWGEWTPIAPFYLYLILGSGLLFYSHTPRISEGRYTEVGLNDFLEVLRNEVIENET